MSLLICSRNIYIDLVHLVSAQGNVATVRIKQFTEGRVDFVPFQSVAHHVQ